MRLFAGLLAAYALIAAAPSQNAPDPALSSALAGVGAPGVASLRSVVLTGSTRNLIGSTGKLSAERPMEIRVSLPDKYLSIVKRDTVELRAGFDGQTLLNASKAVAADTTYGSTYGAGQIGIERARFARLMLGMFAFSGSAVPLVFKRANATTIVATGAGEAATTIELDTATGVPARIRHQGEVRFPAPGSPTPTEPQQTEIIWTFSDRRNVSGIHVPHRIVRSAREHVLEEITFTSVVINPALSGKDFDR
jgi:hypothetical protein